MYNLFLFSVVPVFLSLTPILVLGAPGGARQAHSFRGGFDHRPSSYNYKNTCGRSGVRKESVQGLSTTALYGCLIYGVLMAPHKEIEIITSVPLNFVVNTVVIQYYVYYEI